MAAAEDSSKATAPAGSPLRSGSVLKLPSLPAWATSRTPSPAMRSGAASSREGEMEGQRNHGTATTRKSPLASTSRASPLPNGRFIPESERGWVYDDGGPADIASKRGGERRRSSLASKQWLDFRSSSKIKAGDQTATPEDRPELMRTRSRSTPATNAANIQAGLRGDALSAAASRAAPVMEEEMELEQRAFQRGLDQLDVVDENVARPSSRKNSFDASAEHGSVSFRQRRRRRSLQEASQSEAMYDEEDLKNASRSHRLQVDTEVPVPAAQVAQDASSREKADQSGSVEDVKPRVAGSHPLSPIESPPPVVHTPRGYPWRDVAMSTSSSKASSGLPTFVSPSHRNPTAKQAFYDTHFGASSGWQSLSSLAEPVRHPWDTLRGKRKHAKGSAAVDPIDRVRDEAEQHAKEQQQQSQSILNAGTNRIKEMLSGWNGLTSLGVLGPSSMANDGPQSARDGPTLGLNTAGPSVAAAYEPELIPTVHKDPCAKRYFDNIEGNVVIMGGYRGSVLRDAETGQMLWIPIKVGVGLRRPTLELDLDVQAEANSEELVVPGESLMGIGRLVDMGGRLASRIEAGKKRPTVHSWGYDWRLSLHRSSKRLRDFLTKLYEESHTEESKRQGATVVAHSMGGLVALHALAQTSNPNIFDKLILASTPFAGTANILGPFRYGDAALFNDEVCSPRATFSFRSSFGLLPRDGRCFESEDGKPFDLDFFDPNVWDDLGLTPCLEAGRFKEYQARVQCEGKTQLPALDEHQSSEASVGSQRADRAQSNDVGLDGGLDLQLAGKASFPKGGQAVAKAVQGTAEASRNIAETSKMIKDESLNAMPIASAQNGVPTTKEEAKKKTYAAEAASTAPSEEETWAYLVRTLDETRRFHKELEEGFDEARLNDGQYPPIAILASGRTPTVRGALVRTENAPSEQSSETESWKIGVRAGDYSRMLYEPGDGVITLRSAMDLPGSWSKLLVRGEGKLGEHHTSHRHVTLLSDVQGIGRCVEQCRLARAKQAH
ncbi:hypothetical protein IE81DRAFT_194207 [Ceraceosorus guamensis]|uniref:Alpha/beta-hydrolase n=1 Tax=Ceraceosorus guamensis TaxID=1522189 RepID=A0A316W8X4_9BASI|nr:hypothetical protein IE81DRAFT_194207 [Ceraceosorus guamensis]PWN45528.1 hypothetical protein IE81DRAFT_194207 [Ceraceosorus guamensis]